MARAFKISTGKKSDGGDVYALKGLDGRYHVSEFASFSEEMCEELGYKAIPDDVALSLDKEQKVLYAPLVEVLTVKGDVLWE